MSDEGEVDMVVCDRCSSPTSVVQVSMGSVMGSNGVPYCKDLCEACRKLLKEVIGGFLKQALTWEVD